MRCREGESREDGGGRRRRRARSARSGKGGARAVAVAVQWHSNSGTPGRRCRRGEDLLLFPSPGARRARSPFLSAARRCVPPAAVVKERSTVGLRLGCGIGLRIWERARSRSKKPRLHRFRRTRGSLTATTVAPSSVVLRRPPVRRPSGRGRDYYLARSSCGSTRKK